MCRHPGCEKLYSSSDAVRKHCRKQHGGWLESLGALGNPTLIAMEILPTAQPPPSAAQPPDARADDAAWHTP